MAGICVVAIDNLKESFTVKAALPGVIADVEEKKPVDVGIHVEQEQRPSGQIKCWFIGGIVAVIVVSTLMTFWLRKRHS